MSMVGVRDMFILSLNSNYKSNKVIEISYVDIWRKRYIVSKTYTKFIVLQLNFHSFGIKSFSALHFLFCLFEK